MVRCWKCEEYFHEDFVRRVGDWSYCGRCLLGFAVQTCLRGEMSLREMLLALLELEGIDA